VADDKKEGALHTNTEGSFGSDVESGIYGKEAASIAEDSSRARRRASGWLRTHRMNIRHSVALKQERWTYCTRGTIDRWFDELLLQPDGRIDASLAVVPRDEESVEGF
jgi:hypothetical protein